MFSIDFCAKICVYNSSFKLSIFKNFPFSRCSEQLIYYKFWLLRLGWSMKLCFWSEKILISIAISSKNVKPKELVRLNNLCSQNREPIYTYTTYTENLPKQRTFTENLYSSLERPHFTCTQCMINKKNLESYNFFAYSSFLCVTAP